MRHYPKRPYLIEEKYKDKYFIVVPACLLGIIINGFGLPGCIIVLVLTFLADLYKSDECWKKKCDFLGRYWED